MSLLPFQCTVDNLREFFIRETFIDVTAELKDAIIVSEPIMLKYLKRKFHRDFLFHGFKYHPGFDLNNNIWILDTQTNFLYFDADKSTKNTIGLKNFAVLDQTNSKDEWLSEETRAYITRNMNRGQRLKGIRKIETETIVALKNFYEIDDFNRKWITDIDFVYSSNMFIMPATMDGTIIPKFIHLSGDRVMILYATKYDDVIHLYSPENVYSRNNKKIMKQIPAIIKKGGLITRIIDCIEGLIIEKETGVTWFVLH